MTKSRTDDGVWMNHFLGRLMALICLIGTSTLVVAETVYPAKLSSGDLTGKAFDNPNTIVTETPTGNILDITSLK